jgi:hypothetical protein
MHRSNGLTVFAFLWAACLPVPAAGNPTQTAEYTVTFEATGNAETHPASFPPNPHFSGLIGGTHDVSVAFWRVGELASPGIESMAETGAKSTLISEFNAAILAGGADSLVSGGGINPSPGSVAVSFQIDLEFPLVTLVSMIAPSPDWFVGVWGLSLLESGDWVEEKVVALLPYDSGTDSGTTYTSPNSDTDPAEPITLITTLPVGNGVPLGTFTFTRSDVPTAVGSGSGTTGGPVRTQLFQNSPNPFNPATTIRFDLGRPGYESLRIFDVRGRVVRALVDEPLPRDHHSVVWDGTNDAGVAVPSGTYFYRLHTNDRVHTRKMVVAK